MSFISLIWIFKVIKGGKKGGSGPQPKGEKGRFLEKGGKKSSKSSSKAEAEGEHWWNESGKGDESGKGKGLAGSQAAREAREQRQGLLQKRREQARKSIEGTNR
jgi:hypothetical protein